MMKRTTLCYIRNKGRVLMLCRNRKPDDPNEGKWLGIGGRIEDGETPAECNVREVLEETGLRLLSAHFHGVIRFRADSYEDEDMYLYSSDDFEPADEEAAAVFRQTGEYPPPDCDEGELAWVLEGELLSLPMWEGDRAFVEKLLAGQKEISMTLQYTGEHCTVIDPEKGKTRIYGAPVKDTVIVSNHRWIDENDEPVIKPVGRNTIARSETRVYGQPDRKTRVGIDSNTRLYEKPATAHQDKDKSAGGRSIKNVMAVTRTRLRGVYSDLRNVRVGDSEKFARFLKILGVFALILLLEIGYFALAHRTEALPDDIKETQKELELTQKETVILQEEIDELGGYDSIEEQRRSWERLKEKVEKAAAETSY